ncbi:MAG TPA: hypothetical protein PLJ18_12025 [Niabella sp.]|nr:hypothetical protein [Niabella sp.]
MKKFTVSTVTTYDSDDMLYYTKIGTNGKDMPLYCIAAGKTITESRTRAEQLGEILTAHFKTETISK